MGEVGLKVALKLARIWFWGRPYSLSPKGRNNELTYKSPATDYRESRQIRFAPQDDGSIKMNLEAGRDEANARGDKRYPNNHYQIPSKSAMSDLAFIEVQMGGGIRDFNR